MGIKGLRHNVWTIKKPPLFRAASSFSLVPLGIRDFGEPPMSECVHGNKGQDDSNKSDGDEVKHLDGERGEAAYRHKHCQS